MIKIGLTGSMAMGKSTAANMLSDIDGVAVFCSDKAVGALYEREEIVDLVKTTFPEAYDRRSNTIDKAKLIELLGRDHEKWDALEDILHPYVIEEQNKFEQEQRRLGAKILIFDIPLLFETGGEQRMDYTLCVSAPVFIQEQRIQERINQGRLTPEDAHFRLERQMSDIEKRQRADYMIPTGQGIAVTRQTIEKAIREIKERHFGNGNECHRPPSHGM